VVADDDKHSIMKWLREPDHVETASLEWLMDWVNRRPIKEQIVIEEQAWRYRDLGK
jgi:hypothetical protein